MGTLTQLGERFWSNQSGDFRNLIEDEEETYLKHPSSRSRTNTPFLIGQAIFLLVLAGLLTYCIVNGDIDRITKGYDDCGNICGKNNDFQIRFQEECKSLDMSDKPFLYISGRNRKCVKKCPHGAILSGYQCNEPNSMQGSDEDSNRNIQTFIIGLSKNLYMCFYEVLSLCAISLAFSFIILLMLRFATKFFIWFTMIGVLSALVGATAYFGHLAYETNYEYLIRFAFVCGVATLVMLVVVVIVAKQFKLITQLLKETEKSISAMPELLFEPIITFVALVIVWVAWFYFTLWIESGGAAEEQFGKVVFQADGVMYFADWYNVFAMLWMVQFVLGCQNMLVAGAVAAWYFTKEKAMLRRPILNSAYNMLKFHLGSISFGSLIIAILQMIRILFSLLRRRRLFCIEFCLSYLEGFVKYFTRNSFIITSIHGFGFREAGSRVFHLLVNNTMQMVAVNNVGSSVLFLSKILVVACTIPIGQLMIRNKDKMDDEWMLLVMIGWMAFGIAHCFICVYEMAIDTICVCFCEDCEANDGVNRPYYMSKDLMAFIMTAQGALKKKEAENATPSVTAAV